MTEKFWIDFAARNNINLKYSVFVCGGFTSPVSVDDVFTATTAVHMCGMAGIENFAITHTDGIFYLEFEREEDATFFRMKWKSSLK